MVDWPTVVVSVGLSVLGSILVTEYQLRRERSLEESDELNAWYDDCASFASEVRRIWTRNFDKPDQYHVNPSEIQSEMSLLERQISRHATEGEQLGAEQTVIDALDELASECKQTDEATYGTNVISVFEQLQVSNMKAVESVEKALEDR
jgi:hypothetical protein